MILHRMLEALFGDMQAEAAAAVAGDTYPRGQRGTCNTQRAGQDLHWQQQQPRAVPAWEPVLRQPRRRQVLREAWPSPGVCRLWAWTVWLRAHQCQFISVLSLNTVVFYFSPVIRSNAIWKLTWLVNTLSYLLTFKCHLKTHMARQYFIIFAHVQMPSENSHSSSILYHICSRSNAIWKLTWLVNTLSYLLTFNCHLKTHMARQYFIIFAYLETGWTSNSVNCWHHVP